MVSASELVRRSGLSRHEAERLLVVASGLTRAELLSSAALDDAAVARFHGLAARRKAGTPLQYLEGTVQFGPLELLVDERALVPRPETERLWERVVELVRDDPPQVIVDLCTGSGNLALALKDTFPGAAVYGTDVSPDALALAQENATHTGLDVTWLLGDLFAPLPGDLRGAVDLIASNPPYVAAGDADSLPVDVRDHEPELALFAGPSGDEVLARIAAEAQEWLAPGGLVACEIGEQQGARATELFAAFDPVVEADLTGRDRYVFGRHRIG